MRLQSVSLFSLLAWISLSTAVAAQRREPTIPEAAERMRPNPLVLTFISEFAVASFDSAIAKSDMIVIGTLRKAAVYLSADERTLYTDYAITPTHVVSARTTSSSKPALAVGLIVRFFGGETVINGVPVKVTREPLGKSGRKDGSDDR